MKIYLLSIMFKNKKIIIFPSIHHFIVLILCLVIQINCDSSSMENICDSDSKSFSKTIVAKSILGDTSSHCFLNASSFTVGGKISGLTGAGLRLILNQKVTLEIPSSSTEFVFPILVPVGSIYEVNFANQADGNFCELINATGKVTNKNIQDIEINCKSSCINCIIFITQNGYPANIGKASNFDSSCQSDPNYPGSGNFKAMVVDGISRRASITSNLGDGQIDWVFKANQAYIRPNGIAIETSNANGLFTSTISTPITTTSSNHWTGLDSDWTTFLNGDGACLKWTTNFSGELGVAGDAYTQDILTLTRGKGLQQCSINRELVCVEQ